MRTMNDEKSALAMSRNRTSIGSGRSPYLCQHQDLQGEHIVRQPIVKRHGNLQICLRQKRIGKVEVQNLALDFAVCLRTLIRVLARWEREGLPGPRLAPCKDSLTGAAGLLGLFGQAVASPYLTGEAFLDSLKRKWQKGAAQATPESQQAQWLTRPPEKGSDLGHWVSCHWHGRTCAKSRPCSGGGIV